MVGRLAVSLRSRACVVLSLNLDLLLRLQSPNGYSPPENPGTARNHCHTGDDTPFGAGRNSSGVDFWHLDLGGESKEDLRCALLP